MFLPSLLINLLTSLFPPPPPLQEANTEYSHLEPLPEHVDENSPYKELGDIEANDLIKFAYQIATGMVSNG